MALTINDLVKKKAGEYKDKVFLCDFETGRKITYQQLGEMTDRLSSGFENLGVRKGDHVALLHPNHSDFILGYFGIMKAGGVAVPINTTYTSPEIKHIINDAKANILVTTEALFLKVKDVQQDLQDLEIILIKKEGETLEEALTEAAGPLKGDSLPASKPEDLAIIFYTSGTTGRPKGVMLTHSNLTFGGGNTAQNYGLRDDDITIAVLPLVHVFANASPVLGSLSSGGTVVVIERFKTEWVYEAIERYQVTWFPGVPTMFSYFMSAFSDNRRDVSSLRMGLSGGATMSAESLKTFEEKFSARILDVYGLTESTGLVTANPVYGVRKSGSIGIVVSGVDVKLIDKSGKEVPQGEVGELIFRGPNATRGYWNLPDETEEKIKNGWVYTGDHSYKDEDGYYYIVGRAQELIISGGYNIYPREVEEALAAHPGVYEVAVTGIPDREKGEIPKAYISLKPGFRVTESELLEQCKKNLAPYKIPQIQFMEELPKSSTGKILKKKLSRE